MAMNAFVLDSLFKILMLVGSSVFVRIIGLAMTDGLRRGGKLREASVYDIASMVAAAVVLCMSLGSLAMLGASAFESCFD